MTLTIFAKYMINKFCTYFPRWKIARYIGMQAFEKENYLLKKGTLRLFMESYLDLTMCVFLSVIAFYEV